MSFTAVVPAFVRTAAGVVQVEAGEGVPDDVLPAEVERLAAAGVISETVEVDEKPIEEVEVVEKPAPTPPRGRKAAKDN